MTALTIDQVYNKQFTDTASLYPPSISKDNPSSATAATAAASPHFDNDKIGKASAITNPANGDSIFTKSVKIVGQSLHEHLQNSNSHDVVDNDHYNDNASFFVCDLGEVYRLYRYWVHKLPRVKPHYAIKCNTDLQVLKLLAELGTGFDCASRAEMETVLRLGVDSSRIIFSNPCKFNSHLKYAMEHGVNLTVFDNEDELEKIAKIHPGCKVLLRIETDDKAAVVRLSTKYGARLTAFDSLLAKAKQLKINLVGVHFHCGAGSSEFDSLVKAIDDARLIFDKAKALGFEEMNVLDIGGGFMISNNFDQVAEVLNRHLDAKFPPELGVQIISEPGRYFVTSAFTLAANVIGKRGSFVKCGTSPQDAGVDVDVGIDVPMVYINDGIYANMNCIVNDHYIPIPRVLVSDSQFRYYEEISAERVADNSSSGNRYPVSVWGQTCDSADVVNKNAVLNHPVAVGDWLFFSAMGAYTLAASTSFNGFAQHSPVIYVSSEDDVKVN